MGWSIGYDEHWKRDVGYGVIAYCDHPGCRRVIDRGLSYICGGDIGGGEHGCGLFFCETHLFFGDKSLACKRCVNNQCEHEFDDDSRVCEECGKSQVEADNVVFNPFKPKPEHSKWLKWKLKDSSWAEWRKQNPKEVAKYREQIKRAAAASAKTVSPKSSATKRKPKNISRSHR